MNSPLNDSHVLPLWHAALVIAPALLAVAAALWAGPGRSVAGAWRAARWASTAALGMAGLSFLAVLFSGQPGVAFGWRADITGGVVMLLVAFVGWVIVRYSQPYLQGEGAERHYVRWLMATLAAVSVVVATNHLLVLAAAWAATSLALHQLLTFFGSRPPAVVAAHKKFIVSRAADLCMLGATALFAWGLGSFQIDDILARAAAMPQLPPAAQAAVMLLAVAALLKCAQLPFHGWLIQVMEAPTPVSALLHAGVVNLGGFVLLRFAPVISEVPAAQALLVLAGTATAVLAALVMTTRISVKVMLAWSTCAQMGFMLMQCGLGAWEMALLHLLAHSLYKAHAFLGAGGAVRRALLVNLTPCAPAPGAWALASGAVIGVAMTLAAGAAWGLTGAATAHPPALWVLAGIVALSLTPLVHAQAWRLGGGWLVALAAGAFGVAFAYFGLHLLFASWVLPTQVSAHPALWVGVAFSFMVLFALQSLVAVAPQGRVARGLYPWFYGGLFLDEKFNRVAFSLWGPPQPKPDPSAGSAADPHLPGTASIPTRAPGASA